MFTPPKLEIRHKNPTDPKTVKSDIQALLKLFSKNKKEYDELLKHLSSVRAETPTRKHLNLHIHSSDPQNTDRLEAYRRYQLMTALEIAHNNSPEDSARIFTSIASAYSDSPWNRGISKSIGFSRFESRKRSMGVFEEIDRLDALQTRSPTVLIEEYDAKINELASEEQLKSLLKIELNEDRAAERVDFFEDLYLLSPENSPLRKKIINLLTQANSNYLHLLLGKADVLRGAKFISSIIGDPNVTPAAKMRMSSLLNFDFTTLEIDEKIGLLSHITQNLSPEQQRAVFELKMMKSFILPSVLIAAQKELKKDPSEWRSNFAQLLFIRSDALPDNLNKTLDTLRDKAFKKKNFPYLKALHIPFFDSPRSAVNVLNDQHKKIFLDFIESELDSLNPDYVHVYNSLRSRFDQKYPDRKAPKNCREAL